METFNLEQFGFSPEQRPNYMLMQVKIMARMVGPDLSEEDWVMRYSEPFRSLVKSDSEFAKQVADGDEGAIDSIIQRLKTEAKPEMSAAA